MVGIEDETVDLIVTSPPYPMIEMWDGIFSEQNQRIKCAFEYSDGKKAFDLMHDELNLVWNEINRVLKPGAITCINIGDATRTIEGNFALYPNHQKVIEKFIELGHYNLPNILWRKVTNAPNKFMGSGMLPVGAYVTLEHEWILIFRKGRRRQFKSENEKGNRNESAFFWEERNIWFNDLWNLQGTNQKLKIKNSRDRSAAFPFEIPYRLINMFSVKGDVVLDPFLGTGTTTIASILSERNSIGIEIDTELSGTIKNRIINQPIKNLNNVVRERINQHHKFILQNQKPLKYYNSNHEFLVKTKQEMNLKVNLVHKLVYEDSTFFAHYREFDKYDSENFQLGNLLKIESA
ncbi:MAG: site-specific DNA-methyltransferase [Flavobacteriaceae bacterium]|nr:site-specific DNA-methyltransferase [Flavobacteriaceae bacterium]